VAERGAGGAGPAPPAACPAVRSAPRIAFVIPARDEEAYIARALESVAAQDWPTTHLEAVVVDNGSRDRTAEVVRGLQAAHPDLVVRLVREPVRGRSRAKNRGVAAAQADVVVFLDADSRAAPDLARHVAEHAEAGWPAGSIRVVADSEDWLDRAFFALMEVGKTHLGVRAQLFFCRRDLFLDLGGFQEDLELAEDLEFLQRLRRRGHPVGHLTASAIATSPRRLRRLPLRLGVLRVFVRWALAHLGVGRRWRY
jgi:1,2-diacylglycerol 3-beta-glucosyltransferase